MGGFKIKGSKYIVRADSVAAFDFNLASFTIDSAYHDIDFSAIVPVGTKIAVCYYLVGHTASNIAAYFRKKGVTNDVNAHQIQTISGAYVIGEFFLPLTNRVAEYKIINTITWSTILLLVKGYFI